MSKVTNPKTGRRITVGGPTWNKLSPRTRESALRSETAPRKETTIRDLPRDAATEIISRLSPTSKAMTWHAKIFSEDTLPKGNVVSQQWVWTSKKTLDKAMKHGYEQKEKKDSEYAAVYYASLDLLKYAEKTYGFFHVKDNLEQCLIIAAGQGKQQVFTWFAKKINWNKDKIYYNLLKIVLEFQKYDFFEWLVVHYMTFNNGYSP